MRIRIILFLLAFSFNNVLTAQYFTEVSRFAGIDHAFKVDLATFGGGAAIIDYDNDGFEDVYLTGGNNADALYKNNGDGTFTNVIEGAGFENTIPIHTQGATAADVNRDGYKDLLVTTMYYKADRELSPNLLFLNNGDGTFKDVTRQYGLDNHKSNSMSASFGDINADGFPDLFVANYFAASPNGVSIFNEQTIINNYAPAVDFLFINTSGEYFVEASDLYGMNHDGFGFEGVFTDWDNDQDLDLLIANDFGFKANPNVALRNDYPIKSLTDKSNGLQLNFGMNAMGIAAGDHDFDGWMDYYVTNISASLFVKNQNGTSFLNFGEIAGNTSTLINNPGYRGVPVSWGANFFDFDHDTDLDLFVNNGALNPTIRPNHNFFFESFDGDYKDVSRRTGVDDPRIGRGSVVFDYDNDGDMDLLVVNQEPRDPTSTLPPARTLLFRNDAANGNWLKIQLKGKRADKNGIGSRVEVITDNRLLVREIDGGSSHMSQNSTIAHFGLGDHETVRSVIVRWVGGNAQQLTNVPANQLLTIEEEISNINVVDENKLKIYPSYFTDFVIIEYELENIEPFDLSLYDIQGKLVKTLLSQDVAKNRKGIWKWEVTGDLVHGMYFIQLRTNDSIIAEKAFKL